MPTAAFLAYCPVLRYNWADGQRTVNTLTSLHDGAFDMREVIATLNAIMGLVFFNQVRSGQFECMPLVPFLPACGLVGLLTQGACREQSLSLDRLLGGWRVEGGVLLLWLSLGGVSYLARRASKTMTLFFSVMFSAVATSSCRVKLAT